MPVKYNIHSEAQGPYLLKNLTHTILYQGQDGKIKRWLRKSIVTSFLYRTQRQLMLEGVTLEGKQRLSLWHEGSV